MAGVGACFALGLAFAGSAVGGPTGGLLHWLAWCAPGVGALVALEPGWWRDRRSQWWLVAALILAPLVICVATTAVSAGLGWAEWDVGGAGLAQWWTRDAAGSAALDVSSLRTVSLLQSGLVLGAVVYGLPQGLGVALWAAVVPARLRAPAVIGLVAALAAVGSAGPIVAWAAFAGLAAGWADRNIWALAGGLAVLHGLEGLGPLLALGPAWAVGWTSPMAWGTAAGLGVLGVLLRR